MCPSKAPLSSTDSSPSMARGYPTASSRNAVGPDQFVAITASQQPEFRRIERWKRFQIREFPDIMLLLARL